MLPMLDIFRYVDVSTVDGETSKLIYGRIKATGALSLEVTSSFLDLSNVIKVQDTLAVAVFLNYN